MTAVIPRLRDAIWRNDRSFARERLKSAVAQFNVTTSDLVGVLIQVHIAAAVQESRYV
jgi:cytochrome b